MSAVRNLLVTALTIICLTCVTGHAQSLSETKIKQICQTIESLTNSGQLEKHFKSFREPTQREIQEYDRAKVNLPDFSGLNLSGVRNLDYTGNGDAHRLGKTTSTGSCSSTEIVNLRLLGSGNQPSRGLLGFSDLEVHADNALRWVTWGGGDSLILILNEPIVVSGSFGGNADRDIKLASWIREGQKRPLCSFRYADRVNHRVVRSNDASLCRAVSAGAAEKRIWDFPVTPQRDALQVLGLRMDSARGMKVDLNQDGQEDVLALGDYASGAGCGSSYQHLVVLNPDGATLAKSPLNKLLQQHAYAVTRFELPKVWSSLQIFLHGSKNYVLVPTHQGAEVSSYWGNKHQTWCQIELMRQFKVDKYYYPR